MVLWGTLQVCDVPRTRESVRTRVVGGRRTSGMACGEAVSSVKCE
jgi:hypothetical protein